MGEDLFLGREEEVLIAAALGFYFVHRVFLLCFIGLDCLGREGRYA